MLMHSVTSASPASRISRLGGSIVAVRQLVILVCIASCSAVTVSPLSTPDGIGHCMDEARKDFRVFFFEDFETASYEYQFSRRSHPENRTLVRGDVVFNGDKSLRVDVNKGDHNGTSLRFVFKDAGLNEPTELYSRYYLRFDESWTVVRGGGKLPGPAGRYGRGGWGGRRSTGANGWSARMIFEKSWLGPDFIDIGFYTYHTDTPKKYGESMLWTMGSRGSLKKKPVVLHRDLRKAEHPGQTRWHFTRLGRWFFGHGKKKHPL